VRWYGTSDRQLRYSCALAVPYRFVKKRKPLSYYVNRMKLNNNVRFSRRPCRSLSTHESYRVELGNETRSIIVFQIYLERTNEIEKTSYSKIDYNVKKTRGRRWTSQGDTGSRQLSHWTSYVSLSARTRLLRAALVYFRFGNNGKCGNAVIFPIRDLYFIASDNVHKDLIRSRPNTLHFTPHVS